MSDGYAQLAVAVIVQAVRDTRRGEPATMAAAREWLSDDAGRLIGLIVMEHDAATMQARIVALIEGVDA